MKKSKKMNEIKIFFSVVFINTYNILFADENSIYDYTGKNLLNTAYILKIFFILILLTVILFLILFLLKKYNLLINIQKDSVNIKSIKNIIDDKKIVIVEIDNKNYILGISKNNLNCIDIIKKGKKK